MRIRLPAFRTLFATLSPRAWLVLGLLGFALLLRALSPPAVSTPAPLSETERPAPACPPQSLPDAQVCVPAPLPQAASTQATEDLR